MVKIPIEHQHHVYPTVLVVEHLDLFQQHSQVSVRRISVRDYLVQQLGSTFQAVTLLAACRISPNISADCSGSS